MSAEANPGEHAGPLLLSERFTRAVDYARTLHIERRKGTEIPLYGASAGRGVAGDGVSRGASISQ